ncbi:hypothetical protein N6H18_06880 [Reichenbachiella agarivorans]|uniref:HmuY protein n=1 Tax=Reichenbachiella agarivorans TaxID=2979464 RepID=A0ABY6CT45_9BACT|nr:HmuY family protein [Reichenbachiella agarivorans]UXP33676.1 hypothetical protein N6H18_06880 [Reichenbachiella agarivorans]
MLTKITYKTLSILAVLSILFSACSTDEGVERIFEAAFQTNSLGLGAADESKDIVVNFSIPTIQETTVTIEVTENGVSYGSDYETEPVASEGTITVTVPAGATSAQITVTRLVDFLPAGNSIDLTLASIAGEESPEIVGNAKVSILFEEVVSTGGTIDLLTGGSNMPNQCYIDLSNYTQTAVRRDTWELAFYSGAENKVFLNAALLVSAAELVESTDIDAVNSETVFATALELSSYGQPVTVNNVSELKPGIPVGYYMYGNYTDNKAGTETAIKAISATDAENKVYIVSLGYSIPEESEGSLKTTEDERGLYKIRVLLDGENYKLQYAELDATTHQEVTISKDASNNHVFFSLVDEKTVVVEPAKSSWDINFSGVFSYFEGGFGLTYSDYALHNTLGGTGLYQVLNASDVPSYDDFTLADVEEMAFVYDNRAVIGSDWRNSGYNSPATLKDDRYYVVKDVEGNYFKLKFTRLSSETGVRGHSQFVYELL